MKEFLLAIYVLVVLGCGASLDTTETFEVQIMGTNVTPSNGASGDKSPLSQDYILTGVSLLSEDGSETTILFSGETLSRTRVVNRPQRIFTKDITAQRGNSYSAITLSFSASITGISKESEDHSFTMANSDITLTTPFETKLGEDILVLCKIKWKNTISGATMTEPEYSLSIGDNG